MTNNELIAEFMGLKKCDCESCKRSQNPMWREGASDHAITLRYHDSWDWLMLVINKMRGDVRWDYTALKSALITVNIKAAYGEVVEYIKWKSKYTNQ